MTVKSISTSLLAFACAATALAQTATPPGIRRLPARPARQAPALAQTNDTPSEVRQLPVRSSSLSRSPFASASSMTTPYIAPTAKSDDLVESPATNVVKGAFGYTLGAIWDEPIPEDAEPVVVRLSQPRPAFGQAGEVTFDVEPKTPFPPFDSVTLSVSTNDHRIAVIAAKTPRIVLAESYTETQKKASEIARGLIRFLGIDRHVPSDLTNIVFQYNTASDYYHFSIPDKIMAGKLYQEYLKAHPDDLDYGLFKDKGVWLFIRSENAPHLIAGSRYNEMPVFEKPAGRVGMVRGSRSVNPAGNKPDYLQTIEQPLELTATYYPYVGDAVIRFSVRDVEDRMEHTNLVSVAELKKRAEEEATKNGEEKAATPSSYMETLRRRQMNRAGQAVLTEAEQAFKDSLYRLSFAEAVEKAKANNPEALLRIALAYTDGDDIQQNSKKAREYIEKACELEYGYAQYLYGLVAQCNLQPFSEWSRFCDRCRHFGLNTSISGISSSRHANFAKAVQLFEQAVSNGVSFAQADLEYAREKLKAAEEEEERKKRNAELLKDMTGDESQKKEEESKRKGESL